MNGKSIFFVNLVCSLFLLGFGQTRVIPHITFPISGFETSIHINNLGSTDINYSFQPYNSLGIAQAKATGTVTGNSIINITANDLFANNELITHFVIENTEADLVVLSSYKLISTSSPAYLEESTTQATRYIIYPGDWDLVYDGFGCVNMGSNSASITVKHFDKSSNLLLETNVNSNLVSMGHFAYVIGGPFGSAFTLDPEGYFEVSSSQPLSFMALRGTIPGTDVGFLWQNPTDFSTSPNQRYILHITNDASFYDTKIYVENLNGTSSAATISWYTTEGVLVSQTNHNFNANSINQLTIPDNSIAYAKIDSAPTDLHFYSEFSAKSGTGSPARTAEVQEVSKRWELLPGNWDQIWDGVAVLNTGTEATDVFINYVDDSGQVIHSTLGIRNLAPNAKDVILIETPQTKEFNRDDAAHLYIAASSDISVMALTGTMPGSSESFLWGNPLISQLPSDIDNDQAFTNWPLHNINTSNSINGYIYSSNDVIFLPDTNDIPSGYSALSNISIQAIDVALEAIEGKDGILATTTSDTNGFYSFDDLPSTLIRLQTSVVKNKAQGMHYLGRYSMQNINVGKTFAFDRTSAAALASDGAIDNDLIMGTLEPLPSGTIIFPTTDIPNGPLSTYTTSNDEWFFMIDHHPRSLKGHEFTYICIDANTGAETYRDIQYYSPSINYAPIWKSEKEYYHFSFDWELFDFENDIAPDPEPSTPSPELIKESTGSNVKTCNDEIIGSVAVKRRSK